MEQDAALGRAALVPRADLRGPLGARYRLLARFIPPIRTRRRLEWLRKGVSDLIEAIPTQACSLDQKRRATRPGCTGARCRRGELTLAGPAGGPS